jgi:hypothetical protein
VVDAREELRDVGLEDILVPLDQRLAAGERPMRPFADAIREGVREKTRSNNGSITAQSAWWTTRSRNGAALIFRRAGSWTTKFRYPPGRYVPSSSSRWSPSRLPSRSSSKLATSASQRFSNDVTRGQRFA